MSSHFNAGEISLRRDDFSPYKQLLPVYPTYTGFLFSLVLLANVIKCAVSCGFIQIYYRTFHLLIFCIRQELGEICNRKPPFSNVFYTTTTIHSSEQRKNKTLQICSKANFLLLVFQILIYLSFHRESRILLLIGYCQNWRHVKEE